MTVQCNIHKCPNISHIPVTDRTCLSISNSADISNCIPLLLDGVIAVQTYLQFGKASLPSLHVSSQVSPTHLTETAASLSYCITPGVI